MKRFINQLLCFFFVIIIILALLISGTLFILSSASFKIPDDKTILVIGDSHTECAVNDNIFSRAINVSQSGTIYFYSYIKLRKFLDINPHIDKVILSFHSISTNSDWIFTGSIRRMIASYFSFFHCDEMLLFANNVNFYIGISEIPKWNAKVMAKFIFKKNITYGDLPIGGYIKIDRDKLQMDIELRKGRDGQQNKKTQDEYSQVQLDYLLKIAELCREKNIELILFNSPTYNSGKYGNKSALLNFYNTYLSEIKYLDFSDFALPEYGYGDIGHLNYKGAEIFSRYLETHYETLFGGQ